MRSARRDRSGCCPRASSSSAPAASVRHCCSISPPPGSEPYGITDADRVDLTNLQRQIVHATDRIGALKVDSARHTLAAVNPGVRVETHPLRLGPDNAVAMIRDYDLVRDGQRQFRDAVPC